MPSSRIRRASRTFAALLAFGRPFLRLEAASPALTRSAIRSLSNCATLERMPAHGRLRPWADSFAITTKVAAADPSVIRSLVASGLDSLGLSSIETLLVHDWDELPDAVRGDVVNELGALLESGVVSAVGVSVYSEDEVAAAQSAFLLGGVPLGAVQVPANAIDDSMIPRCLQS